MKSTINKTLLIALAIQSFGLMSCSKDKSQNPVTEYDMWENAPTLSVLRSEKNQDIEPSSLSKLTTQDALLLADPKSQSPSTQGVIKSEVTVQCEDQLGKVFDKAEEMRVQSQYKVLDLMPVDSLPLKGEDTLTCSFTIKLTNSFGSTRTRKLQNLEVQYVLSEPALQIQSAKAGMDDSALSLNTEEVFQTNLLVKDKSKSLYALKCTDFSANINTDSPRLHDLALSLTISADGFDPRVAYPIQTCRIFQRTGSSETYYSKTFEVKYPVTAPAGLVSTIAINDTWNEPFMHSINFVRTTIPNNQPYPFQVRFRKNRGSVMFNVMSGTQGTFGSSSRTQRPLNVKYELVGDVLIEEADGFVYATLKPNSKIDIITAASIQMGCFSPGAVTGMDYTLSDLSLYNIERAERPVRASDLAQFNPIVDIPLSVSNLYKVNGAGRESFYMPAKHSSFQGILTGSTNVPPVSCW